MRELKIFRVHNNLTQEELGEYLGMKKSFISRIENGREKMPKGKLDLLFNNNMGWDTSMLILQETPSVSVSATSGRDSHINVNSKTLSNSMDSRTRIAVLEKQVEMLEKQLEDKEKLIEYLKTLIK